MFIEFGYRLVHVLTKILSKVNIIYIYIYITVKNESGVAIFKK